MPACEGYNIGMQLSGEQRSLILNLARGFVRHALEGSVLLNTGCDDAILRQYAGCFLSLHCQPDHQLRGCVGRIDASQSLLEALRTAASQVLRDPRFSVKPVTLKELPLLEIEVSVLSPLRPVPTPLDFNPPTDGIYLSIGKRSGCFLPQVAQETGWTREQLLDRLCTEKMGLPPGAWRGPQALLNVFSVIVIGPESFENPIAGSNWKTIR